MTYLPYLLLTPLVWLGIACFIHAYATKNQDWILILGVSAVLTAALWGVLLLVIN